MIYEIPIRLADGELILKVEADSEEQAQERAKKLAEDIEKSRHEQPRFHKRG